MPFVKKCAEGKEWNQETEKCISLPNDSENSYDENIEERIFQLPEYSIRNRGFNKLTPEFLSTYQDYSMPSDEKLPLDYEILSFSNPQIFDQKQQQSNFKI